MDAAAIESAVTVVSWNINGLRSVCPRDISQLFELLPDRERVGFLCVQETKLSRLSRDLCVCDDYYSYFSVCRNSRATGRERGYSGVATLVRKDIPTWGAQEGFIGRGDRALDVLSVCDILEGRAESPAGTPLTLDDVTALSEEGRVMITDHGCFVLVNVYAPCAYEEGSARFEFKTKFNAALDMYVAALHSRGRRVVLAGDLNASASRADHCDPDAFEDPVFEERASVRWLTALMRREGLLDSFRLFHPARREAFTCWNTKTGARQTNYGTRIDLILVSQDLAKPTDGGAVLVGGDIRPEVQGSDHCPVWAALRLPQGTAGLPAPPPLCTIHRPDFRLEQGRIDVFLAPAAAACAGPTLQKESLSETGDSVGMKRHLSTGRGAACEGKIAKLKQTVLFSAPPSSAIVGAVEEGPQWSCQACTLLNDFQMIWCEACGTRRGQTADGPGAPLEGVGDGSRDSAREQLSALFKRAGVPDPVPLCTGHAEPCVKRTVTKEGPNKGRSFFTCCKPSGDFTKNRLARCEFFEWAKENARPSKAVPTERKP